MDNLWLQRQSDISASHIIGEESHTEKIAGQVMVGLGTAENHSDNFLPEHLDILPNGCNGIEMNNTDENVTIEDYMDATSFDIDRYSETSPQMVTEELITDDWVEHQGEERVLISAEQIMSSNAQLLFDLEVPLPTEQDEYTVLRPYPCDFCSRRFRKKSSLLNHIVAHQNERQHLCKLCGARFLKRQDLINHLKSHAEESSDDSSKDVGEHENFCMPDWNESNNSLETSPLPQTESVLSVTNDINESIGQTSIPMLTTLYNETSGKERISRLKLKENLLYNDSPDANYPYSAYLQHNIETHNNPNMLQLSADSVLLTYPEIDHTSDYNVNENNNNENKKPFVCNQCGQAFTREKNMLIHLKSHRNDCPYECSECNEIFWDLDNLRKHLKVKHHPKGCISPYEDDCDDVERTQASSKTECNMYGDFYCNKCGMSFHRLDLLDRHNKTECKIIKSKQKNKVGDEKDQNCCKTCGEKFTEALDLLTHVETHTRNAPFKCVLCGESFFEEGSIKRHLKQQHGKDISENSCILCGKRYRDRRALIKHSWDHSREKCFFCSKCGKSFHNAARLKRHMISHRDKSVQCEVCHEFFPDGRTLSNHRHSHSRAASGKLFACHECGKTFGSRSSQQIHLRIHTGERPYGCRFCWKAFADGGTLRKHERIHTGEKPYACSVCSRAFNQRVVLREHIRSHHSGADETTGNFRCLVCSFELTSSDELVQHLIQHSDVNTAMKRQPVPGPRKYKRRRKLKQHEMDLIEGIHKDTTSLNDSDIDIFDSDVDIGDDFLDIATEVSNSPVNLYDSPNSKTDGNILLNKHSLKVIKLPIKDTRKSEIYNNEKRKKQNRKCKLYTKPLMMEETYEYDSNKSLKTQQSCKRQASRRIKETKTRLLHTSSNKTLKKLLILNTEDTFEIDDVADENTIKSLSKSSIKTKSNQSLRMKKELNDTEGTSQRTRQVNINRKQNLKETKNENLKRSKNPEKHPIQALSINLQDLKKSEYISNNMTSLVDDYDIISPDLQLPKQISSSPLRSKLDLHQCILKTDNKMPLQKSPSNHQNHMTSELYDAHLLLEDSGLRNDFDDILRSPLKSEKDRKRQRFTSESSTQFIVEQNDEIDDQLLIKIEPTSPNLREIVNGASSTDTIDLESNHDQCFPILVHPERPLNSSAGVQHLLANDLSTSGCISNTLNPINDTDMIHKKKVTYNTTTSNKLRSEKFVSTKSTIYEKLSHVDHQTSDTFFDYSVGTAFNSTNANNNDSFSSISAIVKAADATVAAQESFATLSRKPQRYFECEMCSAVFPDRAQLLDHVPIHI